MQPHKIVSHEEWIAARKAHLADEKAFTARARRAEPQAPRTALGSRSTRTTCSTAPDGKETLADLFGGKSQLIVYHFMLGPDWEEGCPSCSLLADHFDGAVVHLAQRDVAFVVVSRAPLAADRKVQAAHGLAFQMGVVVRQRLQLRLPRVGDAGGEGERQGRVQLRARTEFPSEERPGASVFYKNDGRRDLPHLFELRARPRHPDRRLQLPRHRAEGPRRGRPATGRMAWVRHHDRYDGAAVDPNAQYEEPKAARLSVLRLGDGRCETTHQPERRCELALRDRSGDLPLMHRAGPGEEICNVD